MSRRRRARRRHYRRQIPYRTATPTTREERQRAACKLRFIRCGKFDELDQIGACLTLTYERDDGDGFLLVADNPRSGAVATLYDGSFAIIT